MQHFGHCESKSQNQSYVLMQIRTWVGAVAPREEVSVVQDLPPHARNIKGQVITQPSSNHHSTIIQPSSNHHFNHHATIIQPSFNHHSTIFQPSLNHHSTIMQPSCNHAFCHPFIHSTHIWPGGVTSCNHPWIFPLIEPSIFSSFLFF